jgi:hypothetical protein
MPSQADDFLHRLLAAHHALDAFDHDPEDEGCDGPGGTFHETPAAGSRRGWELASPTGVPWLGGPAHGQALPVAAAAA